MKSRFRYIQLGFLCIAGFIMLPAGLYAQQYGLKLYNVNDGLPVTLAHSIYQDKYGYLWVGSPGGLSRFDGRQFINYSLADGLPSLFISKIFQDSHERLWIGTNAGMAQFKNNRFITYPTNDKMFNAYVFNFIETKNIRTWALTTKGAYEFADSIWKKIPLYPGYENRPCRNAIEKDGELYVSYPTDIVCRNREGKWLHIASSGSYGSIFNVMSVQDNQVWVNTSSNIYSISNHQLVPLLKKNIASKWYFSYLLDSKKRLWIDGENFLKVSGPGDWQHFRDSLDQPGDCNFIYEDSSHNIWVGSTNGLLKLRDIAFTTIDKNKNVPLAGIANIIVLPDNRLLFSSGKEKSLLCYADNNLKQIPLPKVSDYKKYYKDIIDAYAFDDKNTLWMVTRFKKFLHFDGKALVDFSAAMHLKTTEHIYDMCYAKKRKQFFICADSTLLHGSYSKLSSFIPNNTGIPLIKPTRVFEIKNGLLLLYIDDQGVYCVDARNNLISLIKETGIDGRNKGIQLGVYFYEGSDGSFWIAVPGLGLYQYGFTINKHIFLKNHITTKNGLQSNNVISLTNDRQNRLWVATNTGLDILQLNKAGNWEVFNYAKAGDLIINVVEFEKLVCDIKGNVWLSSPNKIIKFNPANISLHKEAPRIIIEKVSLAFKETNWSKLTDSLYSYFELPRNPALNYSQNSLGIFFNAIDLSVSNSNPEYSYQLLPLDTSWSIPSKTKSVSFAQLPSGTYKFMVRAKDLASGWSKPAVFGFTIKPPFWNKWWFRITIIGIAALIIVTIFRARIRKIKEDAFIENQLKELELKALKAQMNPHFIYNALNSIQSLVASDKKEEGIHYIGSFSRLLRQVLDNSENNVITLDKELETIGLYIDLESLRLDMQLQYKMDIPQNIVTEFEKVPPLILQPFVENALWHGLSQKQGEKEIKITVSITADWLICDIADNGIGREKAGELKNSAIASHQSKGIEITRKRLIDFNGDDSVIPIEFFDRHDNAGKPSGTGVTVHIKRKLNSPVD